MIEPNDTVSQGSKKPRDVYDIGDRVGFNARIATHKSTGHQVNIQKHLYYNEMTKHDLVEKFAARKSLSSLSPYLLNYYDFFVTKRHVRYVREHCEEVTLFDYLMEHGAFSGEQTLRLMAQIVQVFEFCHSHSWYSLLMDLDEIYFDENTNTIKVGRLLQGASKVQRMESMFNHDRPAHYCAPEHLQCVPYDGCLSDVWTLGVLFYCCATRTLPFDSPSISELLSHLRKCRVDFDIIPDKRIRHLVSRMLCPCTERIRMKEIRHHRAWHDNRGVNLYFPPE